MVAFLSSEKDKANLKERVEQLEAKNERLKKDIEQRKDYEGYLQSTKEPMYSYVSWQKQKAEALKAK